ncbi:ABC transporter permease [Allobaculum stercoricanis]|uniref:ABC transporter permease n=1 Tax=Allobaculum stercoricanis TaxID=174709 RepID=UPI0029437EE9|nr:ABC transporter permease [Allobaculum stercoricanis]
MQTLREFYEYRELLKTNVRKDIRGRYKGSILGMLWSFINPLLQVFVYYLVFPYLMRGSMENFLVFLITAFFPWNFFLASINGATGCIKANAGIIKKVYFPRKILILSQVISNLINFFFAVPIILIFVVIFQIPLTWNLIFLPLIAVVEALLCYGCGLILSAINVYVQDVENLVQFFLNLLFYGTPIIYSLDMFPSGSMLYFLVSHNPMTLLMNCYRNVMMYGTMPEWGSLAVLLLISFVLIMIGNWVFDKLQKGFAEEL